MYSTYILNFSLVRRSSEAEVGESLVLENNNHFPRMTVLT